MANFTSIKPQYALKLMKEHPEIIILDVRSQKEYQEEHIPGAISLDYDGHDFQGKVEKLDKNKKYIIYCKSGARGSYFLGRMRMSGFREVYNILGGYIGWKISKLPLTT